MQRRSSFTLHGIPKPLSFRTEPLDWELTEERLTIVAGPRTDLFCSPEGAQRSDNSPAALFVSNDRDFLLRARVHVDHVATFDAGVLQIRADEERWAKLCFELSPAGAPMVVSVVTRGTSDDCNSIVVNSSALYLRIARRGDAFAFHWSVDGKRWDLVRHFTLGQVSELRVGFSAQSPTGEGCRCQFSEARYDAARLADIRDGE